MGNFLSFSFERREREREREWRGFCLNPWHCVLKKLCKFLACKLFSRESSRDNCLLSKHFSEMSTFDTKVFIASRMIDFIPRRSIGFYV